MITTIGSQRHNPCKGCSDRYPACSDHCQKPDFLKWKEEKALIRKNREAYYPPIWGHQESCVKPTLNKKERRR